MKKSFLMLLMFLGFSVTTLHAQIGMAIHINRLNFMQYEPIFVKVTLRNDSGRALLFGKSPRLQGFLMFDIRDVRGRIIPKRKDRNISIDGLVLGPGETRSIILPVNEYYDLDKLGYYTIHAYVAHAMLKKEFRSPDANFRVAYGAVIWKKTVGIPDIYSKVRQQSEERTYQIRTLSELDRRYYYLVVEDEKSVFGVVRIGHTVGREKLQVETDMLSRIHLLVPISPKVFHYLSFSLDGTNIANSFWKVGTTIPQLYRDPKTGTVSRIGGVEAVRGRDFQDPNRNRLKGSKILLDEDMDAAARRNKPRPMKSSDIVDLGKGMEKTVRDSD